MKIIFKKFWLVLFISLCIGLLGLSAFAICPSCTPVGQNSATYCNTADCNAASSSDKTNCQATCQTYSGQLENPLGDNAQSPQWVYGRIIYGFLGITGALALIMFVIGGFQWMTAAGNADRVKKGRDTLMWAVLGLIIIFSSYAILRAVFQILQF